MVIIIIIIIMMTRGIGMPTTTIMLSDSMGARMGSRGMRMIIVGGDIGSGVSSASAGGGGAHGHLEVWCGSMETRLGCSPTLCECLVNCAAGAAGSSEGTLKGLAQHRTVLHRDETADGGRQNG